MKPSLAEAEKALRNTEITQPAMLTANVALLRVMDKFGFQPDMVIGHSLGEYAALVAAGVLTFAEALEVVSARGREMKKVSMDDNGCMAAVSAPIARGGKDAQDDRRIRGDRQHQQPAPVGHRRDPRQGWMQRWRPSRRPGSRLPRSPFRMPSTRGSWRRPAGRCAR